MTNLNSDDGFKYFTGYEEGEIVKPLCIILPPNKWIHKIFWKQWQKHVFHGLRWQCVG